MMKKDLKKAKLAEMMAERLAQLPEYGVSDGRWVDFEDICSHLHIECERRPIIEMLDDDYFLQHVSEEQVASLEVMGFWKLSTPVGFEFSACLEAHMMKSTKNYPRRGPEEVYVRGLPLICTRMPDRWVNLAARSKFFASSTLNIAADVSFTMHQIFEYLVNPVHTGRYGGAGPHRLETVGRSFVNPCSEDERKFREYPIDYSRNPDPFYTMLMYKNLEAEISNAGELPILARTDEYITAMDYLDDMVRYMSGGYFFDGVGSSFAPGLARYCATDMEALEDAYSKVLLLEEIWTSDHIGLLYDELEKIMGPRTMRMIPIGWEFEDVRDHRIEWMRVCQENGLDELVATAMKGVPISDVVA